MEPYDFSMLPLVCFGVVVGLVFDHGLRDTPLRPAVWAFIGSAISLGIADISVYVNIANRATGDSTVLRYLAMAASIIGATRFYGFSERTAIVAIVGLLIGTLVATIGSGSTLGPYNWASETFESTIACSFTVFILALLLGDAKHAT